MHVPFFNKTLGGGITRMKQHLMGIKGNCKPCTKCPNEVKDESVRYMKNKKKQDSKAYQRVELDFLDDYGDNDEQVALDEGFRELASKLRLYCLFFQKLYTIQRKKKE